MIKDIFNRQLHVGDLVLVEGNSNTIRKSNFNIVISEDRVFDGSGTPLAYTVYLVEHPCEAELVISNKLKASYQSYQLSVLKAKQEKSQEEKKKREQLRNVVKPVKGDIFEHNYNEYTIYLGKCKIYNEVLAKEVEGYGYFTISWRIYKEKLITLLENIGQQDIKLVDFLLQSLASASNSSALSDMKESIRRYNVTDPNIKIYVSNASNIVTYKTLSTKYLDKIGHINIADKCGDMVSIYARKYKKWSSDYGTVKILFLE